MYAHVQHISKHCYQDPRITSRFILLCLIAVSRACHFVCEQPGGSCMPLFPYWLHVWKFIQPTKWFVQRLPGAQFNSIFLFVVMPCSKDSTCFWPSSMGAWGAKTLKPSICWGTARDAQLQEKAALCYVFASLVCPGHGS